MTGKVAETNAGGGFKGKIITSLDAYTDNMVDRPCIMCCTLCGMWVLSVILSLVIFVAGGVVMESYSPFWNRANFELIQEDGYEQGQVLDDSLAHVLTNNDAECVNTAPTVLSYDGELTAGSMPTENVCGKFKEVEFNILWLMKDRSSNVFTAENVKKIVEMDTKIRSEPKLTRYCNLLNATSELTEAERASATLSDVMAGIGGTADPPPFACRRPNTLGNFLDPLFFDRTDGTGYYLTDSDTYFREVDATQGNIDSQTAYWASYKGSSFNLSQYDLRYVENSGGMVDVSNIMAPICAKDFMTNGTGRALGVRSVYYMALPLDGYKDNKDSQADQYNKIGEWLYDTFDSYLKGLGDLGEMEIFWSDSKYEMEGFEASAVVAESYAFLALAILFVYFYLIFMLDSLFLASCGIMQILLAFCPSVILYRFVCQQSYFGTLNIIAIFIIVGVGVDDIFVFNDDWVLNKADRNDKRRFNNTFKKASKAMLATSLTTMISFLSNASSKFPAIATFGLFAAMMIFTNYCAVISFYPAVTMVHHKYIRGKYWFDSWRHCLQKVKGSPDTVSDDEVGDQGLDGLELAPVEHNYKGTVAFFRFKWAPLMIRYKHVVLLLHLGIIIVGCIFATQIESSKDVPYLLKPDNKYRAYKDQIGEWFGGAKNPFRLEVYMVTGIDPEDAVDRSGTDPNSPTDKGKPNHKICGTSEDGFKMSPEPAQLFLLSACHDAFWGNVTAMHGAQGGAIDRFSEYGSFGPHERKMHSATATAADTEEEDYRNVVTCPLQGLRDWLLTTEGCEALKANSLPCQEETRNRPNCLSTAELLTTASDWSSLSCEPFPIPEASFIPISVSWLQSNSRDPSTGNSPLDSYASYMYSKKCFGDDPATACGTTCDINGVKNLLGTEYAILPLWTTSTFKTQHMWQSVKYEDGIKIYDKWVAWMDQLQSFATDFAPTVSATYQTSNSVWSFYYLSKVIIGETVNGIIISLVAAALVIMSPMATSNVTMALISTFTIGYIVMCVFAINVMLGWEMGGIEAINYVMVIGLAVDYCVHLSEAYISGHHQDRESRVLDMLTELGVSVVSGAVSSLGCSFFMFFPYNEFFPKFGAFIFMTIGLSLFFSLTFFPALLAFIGPEGKDGDIFYMYEKLSGKMKADCFGGEEPSSSHHVKDVDSETL